MREFLVCTLVMLGSVLMLVAAIGIVRLPDLLCRSHAVAKASTLGIFLLLAALWLHPTDGPTGLKVLLAVIFQLVTIPLSSHLVGLLTLRKNLPRFRGQPRKPGD